MKRYRITLKESARQAEHYKYRINGIDTISDNKIVLMDCTENIPDLDRDYIESIEEVQISCVDKMRPLQIAYNLEIAGVTLKENDHSFIKKWAEQIFEDNKELFKEKSKEEFVNFVVYGK